MELETLRPNPAWDAASYEESVDVLESHRDELTYRVWGGDWCKDCRSQLPDFGAALDAAGVEHVEHYPVEKSDDGSKTGPNVDEYDIELIPTVVVEDHDTGEELARFVENEPLPIFVYLAEQLKSNVE